MRVSVLMAVYHPDRDWLRRQLTSLREQTLLPSEILICDDCPEDPVGPDLFKRELQGLPFSYEVNPENLGSSETFARLVTKASGDTVAFCDQDDVWKPDKLRLLVNCLRRPGVTLAYCDLCVIDARGKLLAGNVAEVRPRECFPEGKNLARRLFVKDSIYGCSILMRTDVAQKALPLPEGMGHDHWFSLYAASEGEIVHLRKPLVCYRLHGENQSTALRHIATKQDYLEERIRRLRIQANACAVRFPCDAQLTAYITRVAGWADARERWFCGDFRAGAAFWRDRAISPNAARFELVLPFLPQWLFRKAIRRIQNGRL